MQSKYISLISIYSALYTLHLYKTKQNRGYQLQAKMNHTLPPLEAVDISDFLYIKFRCFFFVTGDVILLKLLEFGTYQQNPKVLYISGFCLMVKYGLKLIVCYVLSILIK